jgi:SAM-dependent methyltransferase
MTKLDLHYLDPRLVDLYDLENTRGADTDFYVRLAANFGARRIIDLGCGTGTLTRELAVDDRAVVGVDPSPTMLAVARRYPQAKGLRWVEGDADVLGTLGTVGTGKADLLIMTGNVAQVFLDDDEWAATLHAIHSALHPGGHLAFESRNPEDRAWERWNREATYMRLDSPHGPVETWLEVVSVANGRVRLEGHNIFTATGEVVVARSELRFRSAAELTASLLDAGFAVQHVYGDWQHGSLQVGSRIMAFVARRK